MKTFKKLKKGFTLVELVVVIAVIAILAAVSVGAYFGVTESANNSKLEQEAKQVYTAIQTVALAPNDYSSLSKEGLVITDAGEFETALEDNLGIDVALTDVQDTKDPAKPTIYFVAPSITPVLGGSTVYSSFEYYSHEIGGKRAVADVVTGEVDVVNKEDSIEELPENLPTVKTIEEALTAEAGYPARLSGTVSKIDAGWSEAHKNISFVLTDDSDNSILIYRCNTKVEVGDIVTVTGTITNYQGTNQIAQGSTAEITGHDSSYDVEPITTIADALLAEDGAPVILTGEVVNIKTQYNASNNNISLTIKDENGDSIYVYKMNGNAAIHDIITVTGVMDTYNEERQIAEASSFVKNDTAECSSFTQPSCTKAAKCTLCNKPNGEPLGHTEGDAEGNCTRCGTNVSIQEYSITFNNTSKRTVFNETQQVWVEDGITFTNDKDASTSKVAEYIDPVRLYKNSKVTINFPINDIDEIKIVSEENESTEKNTYFDNLVNSIKDVENVVSTNNGTNEIIISNYNSNTLEFSCTGGQVRIYSILIKNDLRNVEPEEPTLYTLTINPTPAEATVVLSAGENIVNGNSIEVTSGTEVTYTVSHDGYNSATGKVSVTETKSIDVELTPIEVIPDPELSEKVITIDFGKDYGVSTSSYGSGTFTAEGITFGYERLKSYHTSTSEKYMMFEKNQNAMLYNTTAIPGKITKLEVKTTAGCSANAAYYISLFTSEKDVHISDGTKLSGKSATVTLTGTESDNFSYFNISKTNNSYNGQISTIIITYLG